MLISLRIIALESRAKTFRARGFGISVALSTERKTRAWPDG